MSSVCGVCGYGHAGGFFAGGRMGADKLRARLEFCGYGFPVDSLCALAWREAGAVMQAQYFAQAGVFKFGPYACGFDFNGCNFGGQLS